MTRNRRPRAEPHPSPGPVRRGLPVLLTLLLLAPAAALLLARVRGLLDLAASGLPESCSGPDAVAPVLYAGLPSVALVMIVPLALLSVGHRAHGWIWLALALVGTVLLDAALRAVLPACL